MFAAWMFGRARRDSSPRDTIVYYLDITALSARGFYSSLTPKVKVPSAGGFYSSLTPKQALAKSRGGRGPKEDLAKKINDSKYTKPSLGVGVEAIEELGGLAEVAYGDRVRIQAPLIEAGLPSLVYARMWLRSLTIAITLRGIGLKNYNPSVILNWPSCSRGLVNNTKRPGVRQNVAKVLDYTITPSVTSDALEKQAAYCSLPEHKHLHSYSIDAISADDLKKLNKNKKLTSSKVPTLVSYTNNLSSKITEVKSMVKLPTLVSYADDLSSKITEVKSTVKF
ncbi:hypothetical protein BT67DRAFT_437066 [Trichocladium antarcticum]|uniref:Uncharacterized protein n=1 Tax=Trichocladium antarcticum TaxID=1450529 RepID=A0AAN6Z937_9PEZI|nr:hypothetical protein BT67DRAFT_437066 [Trichocladium antarcticum]